MANNFFTINFTIFSICFDYALNILTTLYGMGSWNATRTYPVQCWHEMKVNLFVRSQNYTQVCDRIFAGQGRFLRIRAFRWTFHLRGIKESPAVFFHFSKKSWGESPSSSSLIVPLIHHQTYLLKHPKNKSWHFTKTL